jgi:hypothetical protein
MIVSISSRPKSPVVRKSLPVKESVFMNRNPSRAISSGLPGLMTPNPTGAPSD